LEDEWGQQRCALHSLDSLVGQAARQHAEEHYATLLSALTFRIAKRYLRAISLCPSLFQPLFTHRLVPP
jgi:hypothetical protein